MRSQASINFGARYMSFAQGRFTSPDPIHIMPQTLLDPNSNETTTAHRQLPTGEAAPSGQSTYAFPTTVTNALSQKTTYQYDYWIGRPAIATDPNLINTGFAYVDPLDRLTQVTRGSDAAQTAYTYVDTPNSVSVTATSDQTSLNDNIIKTEILYDGLARKVQTEQYADCGYISVQQTYDAMGRPYTATNPYRPCLSEPVENTTTLYDALNRPLTVTTADGSPTTMSYTGKSDHRHGPRGRHALHPDRRRRPDHQRHGGGHLAHQLPVRCLERPDQRLPWRRVCERGLPLRRPIAHLRLRLARAPDQRHEPGKRHNRLHLR
jgi:hypothetical protein